MHLFLSFCIFLFNAQWIVVFPTSEDKFGVILYLVLDILLTAVHYESYLVAESGTPPRTSYSPLQFIAVSALEWSKSPLTDVLTKQ